MLSLLALHTITPGTNLLAGGAGAQTEPWLIEMQFPGLITNAHMIDDGKGFPSMIPPNYASQRKSPELKPNQTTSPQKNPINLSSPETAACEDFHKITHPILYKS